MVSAPFPDSDGNPCDTITFGNKSKKNKENKQQRMFVKSNRNALGDVWESLGILWSDPESSRIILDDFRKS